MKTLVATLILITSLTFTSPVRHVTADDTPEKNKISFKFILNNGHTANTFSELAEFTDIIDHGNRYKILPLRLDKGFEFLVFEVERDRELKLIARFIDSGNATRCFVADGNKHTICFIFREGWVIIR